MQKYEKKRYFYRPQFDDGMKRSFALLGLNLVRFLSDCTRKKVPGERKVRLNTRSLQRKSDLRTAQALRDWVAEGRHLLPTNGMDEVAVELGISKEQLSRFFLHFYREPFLQWRKKQRIAEAKALLLKNPGMSLTDLGFEVGIQDRSNMRRQFMEITGMTPARWIQENCRERSA